MTRMLLFRQCHHAVMMHNRFAAAAHSRPLSFLLFDMNEKQCHGTNNWQLKKKPVSVLTTRVYTIDSTRNPLPFQNRTLSSAATIPDDSNDNDTSVIPFKLADIGEGIKEVELLQWFVQAGDRVQQFDRICEVQSDKATVEITSRYDGIVESLAGTNVGDMVQVGDPLLFIRVEGGGLGNDNSIVNERDKPKSTSQQQQQQQQQQQSQKQVLHSQDSTDHKLHIPRVASQFHLDSDDATNSISMTGRKFLATPAVRKLGMEYNLDLSTLVGTGPQGRVLKSDVLTFLRENGQLKKSDEPSSKKQDAAAATKQDSSVQPASPVGIASTSTYLQEDQVVTLKGYNRLMIQTMTASQVIPHMGYTDEFNLTKLTAYRHDLSPKVSMLAFFIKATSLALKEYPIVNASWKDLDKGQVQVWANHNIGVAMDTPRGLVVPVIHHVQDKSLVEIQQDLNSLKEIAAAGKLAEEHLTGATFSISNIGSLGGGTYMNPLIVPPQAAIGAMGTIQTLPRFDANGNVTAAKIMPISWAGDHRMFDGATLARFSNLCKEYLEDPVRMLVAMK